MSTMGERFRKSRRKSCRGWLQSELCLLDSDKCIFLGVPKVLPRWKPICVTIERLNKERLQPWLLQSTFVHHLSMTINLLTNRTKVFSPLTEQEWHFRILRWRTSGSRWWRRWWELSCRRRGPWGPWWRWLRLQEEVELRAWLRRASRSVGASSWFWLVLKKEQKYV